MRWILLLLLVLLVVAIKFLPWYLVLGGLIVMVFAGKFILQRALVALFMKPFKLKGAVLAGATLEVHEVALGEAPAWAAADEVAETAETGATAVLSAEQPADEEDVDDEEPDDDEDDLDDEEPEERVYYWVDATITPQAPTGEFSLWEPSELVLIAPDADPAKLDEGEVGDVVDVKLWLGDRFVADEAGKYPGPQRVKLLCAVGPDVRAARFRYYFEPLGEVTFPEVVAAES